MKEAKKYIAIALAVALGGAPLTGCEIFSAKAQTNDQPKISDNLLSGEIKEEDTQEIIPREIILEETLEKAETTQVSTILIPKPDLFEILSKTNHDKEILIAPPVIEITDGISTEILIPEPVTPEKIADPSKIVIRGDTTKAEIAFTFDDGGEGLGTILKILNAKGIKGTFFLLAYELKNNPERWRQAIADGHQVCNHTVNHRMDLPKLTEEEMKKEILGWETVAKEVLGEEYVKKMKSDFPYFRAPGGNKSNALQQVLGDLGYTTTAYWSREDCWFKTHNPDNLMLIENYVVNAKNGDIFLAHGGTASAVAEIIEGCIAKGYGFKLLSEILD